MKLAVLTTAFFPDLTPLRMFMASAKKYGIEVKPYGLGEPYCIWADMKIVKKIPVFTDLIMEGYTHVLYTDARDAFFTGPLQEIMEKYMEAGSPPCFASTEKTCNPDLSKKHFYPDPGTPYRFHCVGGYLGELKYMRQTFRRMALYRSRSGDDAAIWQWAWEEGWFQPKLDTHCEIFQTADALEGRELVMQDGRLRNTITASSPCIFHLNGGFSDPITGKWEAMLPWWNLIHREVEL